MENNGNDFTNGSGKTARFFGPAIYWMAAFGIALRLFVYGINPQMWQDEAATTMNILNKSFSGLFGPLNHSATGPSLLLCMQKCLVLLLGDSTYSLRLISVLASCAAVLVIVRLSKALLPLPTAFCAVLMAACSERLLWHASEARHYSSDFLLGAALLLIFVKTRAWKFEKRALAFAAFCPLMILVSYPGVFLCTGLMFALLLEARKENRKQAWAAWFALGVLVTATFAFFYFFTIRPQRSADMNSIWASFFPNTHKPWTLPWWALSETIGVFDYYLRPIGGGMLVPALVGFVIYWRSSKDRPLAVLIAVPMGCAMAAALIKDYPYGGVRTMAYSMPGLTILAGRGLAPTVNWLKRRLPGVPGLALACVLFVPLAAELGFAIRTVVSPWKRSDTRVASEYVLAHRQPGDHVTSNHWEYEYYFRKIGPDFSPEFMVLFSPQERKTTRFWVVLTANAVGDRNKALEAARTVGWEPVERQEFRDTSVILLSRAAQN